MSALPRQRYIITVSLKSGGVLQVVEDFNLIELSSEDREFVYSVRDLMKNYGAPKRGGARNAP